MNETNVRNEILDSIDRVDHITLESSLDVLFSLGTAYEKSAMIMEYASTPDELSMFSIFQEADTPTQDNAAAEAKPAENNAEAKPAENTSTTVSSDDKAPAANAEAKKKSGILWFIPNLLKKLWQFLKDAWNGVIVPKAEQVSEEAQNVFDKIAGKDESWVKEHAVELGLSGAALSAVLAFIAVTRREEITQKLAEWFSKIRVFFKSIKVAPKINFDTDSVKTNLNLEKAPNLFQKIGIVYSDSLKAINTLKDKNAADPVKTITDCLNAVNSVSTLSDESIGPLITEEDKAFTYDDFSSKLSACVESLKSDLLPKEENVSNPSASDGSNLNDESTKKATALDAVINALTKAAVATVGFFKWLVSPITKMIENRKNAAAAIDNKSEGTGEAGENAEAGTSTEETAPATENAGEAATEEKKGYTAQELNSMLPEGNAPLKVDSDGLILSKSGIPIRTPFTLPGGQMKVKLNPDDNKYYVAESAETDIDEEELMFVESYEEELSDADIEVNNHWYN